MMLGPRFFFHMHDGSDHRDAEGVELPSIESARLMAIRYLSERLAEAPEKFAADANWQVQVENEDGLTLLIIYVNEVTAPALPGV